MFQSLEKSAKLSKQHIRTLEDKNTIELAKFGKADKDLKTQLQKVKKELYVTNEKMNLSEKMNKLKDKEV